MNQLKDVEKETIKEENELADLEARANRITKK